MKLKSEHISMLGVGISAVAAIAMILYYRHQAATGSATASDTSGMGAFPYFQTAALPSSVGGGSTVSTPVAAANTAAPALDVNSLVAGSLANQNAALVAGESDSFMTTMGKAVAGLLGQQSGQLANIGQAPVLQTAFATPTPGGGFNIGIASQTVQAGLPNGLSWLLGGTGRDFANPNNNVLSPVPINSTNSTTNPTLVDGLAHANV